MSYHINEKVKGIDINARVSVLNEAYKYYQITPEIGFPFFIRYDRSSRKWRTVAEIFKTDPQVVELVGSWINSRIPK